MSHGCQDVSKNSFEFRMSKKVAELSLVVQILHTSNHEKTAQIDAMKQSYEYEMELMLKDAQERIGKLEARMSELSRQHLYDLQQAARYREDGIAAKDTEWRQKMSLNEQLLQEQRGDCQNMRDLLIGAQRDIEKLRHSATEAARSDQARREQQVDKLQVQLAARDNKLTQTQVEVIRLQTAADGTSKTLEQLMVRNKQLENELKSLRREVSRRYNAGFRNGKIVPPENTQDEVDKLRRELQRYRLELSNRDYNFTRIFTNKQPLLMTQAREATQRPPVTLHASSQYSGNNKQPVPASDIQAPASACQ